MTENKLPVVVVQYSEGDDVVVMTPGGTYVRALEESMSIVECVLRGDDVGMRFDPLPPASGAEERISAYVVADEQVVMTGAVEAEMSIDEALGVIRSVVSEKVVDAVDVDVDIVVDCVTSTEAIRQMEAQELRRRAGRRGQRA